jgi:two-component sensor histidine kinase/tetratricopeptide (TPR) repeat protein
LSIVHAQNFANKNHYLIDSLQLNELSVNERKLIDSSLTLYHNAKHDTIKINAINIIVEESWNDFIWPKYNEWLYAFIQEQLSTKIINKTKNSSVKLFLEKNKSSALNNFGIFYYSKGQYEKAIAFYLRSLSLKKRINDQKGIASVYNNLGGIYDNKGNSPKALEYYLKSLKIRETKYPNDLIGLSISLNNVGQSYYNQGDTEKAQFYFEKSLEINPKAKNNYAKAAILNNIGVIYSLENDFDNALQYFKQSLDIKKTIGDKKGVAISLNSIGVLHKDKEHYEEAYDYFIKSLTLSKEANNIEGQAISLSNLANLNLLTGKLNKAEVYGNESMFLAKELNKPLLISDAAKVLYDIYKKNNQLEDALTMYELHMQMRDSIHNKETEKDLIKQNAAYDLGKKEYEIELLSAQNELNALKLKENKNWIYFTSSAFLFMLVLAVIIYYANQKKQVVNELLEQQKEEVSIKNKEKEIMLKEIHHRVKNNLQVVNSLLRFQSRNIEDKNVLEMFKSAQKRVLSMAMLHEKMYRSDDLKHINVKEHFTHLVEDLIENYTIDKKIDLSVDIDNIPIDISVLTPLGLIVSELITNSIKYGFPNKTKGQINVSLKQHPSKKIELFVFDNGVGYNPNEINEGLGTKLVHMYTKQLNGKLEKVDQGGTAYKLVF